MKLDNGQKSERRYIVQEAVRYRAGLWENWKEPATGAWIRTFAVITTPANELFDEIAKNCNTSHARRELGFVRPRTGALFRQSTLPNSAE